MARYTAVASVGKSLERLLDRRLADDVPVHGQVARAKLVRTEDFANGAGGIARPSLTIFLAQVAVNQTMRAAWAGAAAADGQAHLPLDLHFLLTPWAANAEWELLVLGSAMRCLEDHPILSGPLLDTTTAPDWDPDEALQVVPDGVGAEGVLRMWDVLEAPYRLSVPYVARVLRIDGGLQTGGPPVLTAIAGAKPGLDP